MFEFEINDEDWTVEEADSEWITEEYNKMTDSNSKFVFGLTNFPNRKIYINKSQNKVQKERTLLHELMHAYLWSVGICSFEQFDEEDLCNISSASHYIIHDIFNKYQLYQILPKKEEKDNDRQQNYKNK